MEEQVQFRYHNNQTRKNIGAVGVTGDVSDQDEICAIAGIESSNLTPGHKSK